jgi:uncharacterized protein (DUF1778 family)
MAAAARTLKSRRMEQRVDEETERMISQAATVTHESVSAFVTRSARDEANRVLARAETTLMPAEQFDAMIAALDEAPRRLARLAEAAARPRAYDRA